MDKERFNTLLADMDKITDTDIKSMNQLRKQYPYFQNQYVMIAKALKSRNHPKTDAFIKKAAIYSADRALLKSIIMDEHAFPSVAEEPAAVAPIEPPKVVHDIPKETAEKVVPIAPPTVSEPKVSLPPTISVETSKETLEEPKSESAEAYIQKSAPAPLAELKTPPAPATEKEIPASPEKTVEKEVTPEVVVTEPKVESNQALMDELARDLIEIRKKKQLIAKMLEQQEAKQAVKKPREVKKKGLNAKTSQSELIEKFIQNEPQMGKQKLTHDESEQVHKDLAAQFIRESEDFHTETMAKLMVGQKKYKKAVQIYEKLGLKFPEKRAYFASQIEKVKKKSNG